MPDELVPIATFVKPTEAAAARFALEAQGINCFLKDDNLVGMNWLLGNAVGYVKLLVAAADAERAAALIDTPYDDWPAFAQPETWKCRQCGDETDNRFDRCRECGTPRHPENTTAGDAAFAQTLLEHSDETKRQAANPYAPPRAGAMESEADDVEDDGRADEAGPRARCPSCVRARMAVCPFCNTSGTRFRTADTLDEHPNEEPALLVCPTCDEPFEAAYLRRCEWCGHDFGSGLEAPEVLRQFQAEPLNWRVLLVGFCGVAIVAGLVAYFAVLLS